MLSVVSFRAEAGSVVQTLAVQVAVHRALLVLALQARVAGLADAHIVLALTVRSTVKRALLNRTVRTGPATFADALS